MAEDNAADAEYQKKYPKNLKKSEDSEFFQDLTKYGEELFEIKEKTAQILFIIKNDLEREETSSLKLKELFDELYQDLLKWCRSTQAIYRQTQLAEVHPAD